MPKPGKFVDDEDLAEADADAAERDLDEALAQTFPASDPIAPMERRRPKETPDATRQPR
jgi:hypothetical protein